MQANWQWTQDGRGGGSQNSLSVQGDTLIIAPAEHVHFTNLDTVLGDVVYRFRFNTETRFAFAWRVSPQNAQGGTGLIFQTEGTRGLSLIHVSWSGFFYGWHNAGSFRNTLDKTITRGEWHEVEIHDTGTDITVYLDNQKLPFFDGGGSPVERFLSDVSPGYVGIGGGEGGTVQYQDLSFSSGESIVPQVPSRSLPSPGFQPSGLAFDGTALYVSEISGFRRIFKLDPETGRALDSFLAPSPGGLDGRGNPNGLAADGLYIDIFLINFAVVQQNILFTKKAIQSHNSWCESNRS